MTPKLLRVDPFVFGLAPRDRLAARAPHPLRMLADGLARSFGDLKSDLYADASSVSAPRLLPGETSAIVLPRGYGDLSENEQAVGFIRLFVYLALDVPWLDELGGDDMDGLLLGALRVGNEAWGEGKLSAAHDAAAELWRPRIAKAASRKLKRTLEELAVRMAPPLDTAGFRHAVRVASLRAAFAATGDIVATLHHLQRIERAVTQAPRPERLAKLLEHTIAQDLILYALSEAPAPLRRQMGTASHSLQLRCGIFD